MKLMRRGWLIVLAALLVACGSEEDSGAEESIATGHVITGEISGGDGQAVQLYVFEEGEQFLVDSAKILNGSFTVETETKDFRQYLLMVGDDQGAIVLFLDQESQNVKVTGTVPGFQESYDVEGSEASKQIIDYIDFLGPHNTKHSELRAQWNVIPPTDSIAKGKVMAQMDSISAIRRDYAIKKINEDPAAPLNLFLIRDLIPESGIANFDSTDLQYFEKVSEGLRGKYPESEYPDLIDQDIVSIQGQIVALNNPQPEFRDEMGAVVPDINLPNQDGTPLALSSLRGNVVLIDFWASWCGPCRMENPNVVKAYDKWKDKGFTVYSVSLDNDKAAWLKAINADNLTWPNHVSDLRGWESSAAAMYKVRAIPSTWLIDQEGRIIGRNLRGGQLEQKLQEVLG